MLKLAASLPFLLAAAAQAQQPRIVIAPTRDPFNLSQPCPIAIAARHHDTTHSTFVTAANSSGTQTGIHVNLTSLDTRTLTHLTVEILYRPYPQGVVPVSTAPTLPDHKTFELDAAEAGSLSRNLLVAGNVDIQRIHVLSVLFSDGSTWKAPATSNTCSIKPSHVILVGAR